VKAPMYRFEPFQHTKVAAQRFGVDVNRAQF
jgi:hypothetical protein